MPPFHMIFGYRVCFMCLTTFPVIICYKSNYISLSELRSGVPDFVKLDDLRLKRTFYSCFTWTKINAFLVEIEDLVEDLD